MPTHGRKRRPASAGHSFKLLLSTLAIVGVTIENTVEAAPGEVWQTPATPMELPVEVEIELAPAASLKQAPLWKELIQLLRSPYGPDGIAGNEDDGTIVRRPGFGVTMPPLNVWSRFYNFLTSQPLRLRTNDGELSWDQPGLLFDPDEEVQTNEFNVPQELRSPIGALVVDRANRLRVSNPGGARARAALGYAGAVPDPRIPPHNTIVAVPAYDAQGRLRGWDPETQERPVITELEVPVNEEHFFQPVGGRQAAEVLGKALFWDMQVGSDGVQACGTCHFNAGVDNRTKNQLNPNHLGGDLALEIRGPNEDVVGTDFPFHKLANPDNSGESVVCGIAGHPACADTNVVSDSNDIMSSMGVRFRQFVDIPPIGGGDGQSFGPAVNGVRPLLPDVGTEAADLDPIDVFDGVRRVEPRHTPSMHAAAFNLDNFWDGRARFVFNGGSVFGPSDPYAHVFVNAEDQLQPLLHPLEPFSEPDDPLEEWTNGEGIPVRIKFSSLASQAIGPPLSDFEMSFLGRSWAKIGKKLLQGNHTGTPVGANRVVPLANQLVATTDSVLGPYSNQGGSACGGLLPSERSVPGPYVAGKPGLCISYAALIRRAYPAPLWDNDDQHLAIVPEPADGFDGIVLEMAAGPANPTDRNQLSQMEANFALFFGLSVQAYEQLLIPDDTPFDRFMDANPLAANGIGEPGSQGVLIPKLVRDLVGGGVTLIPDDMTTPEYDGFGEEELFGFDIFAGGNLTAALPVGTARNPTGVGSNPFARSARCMLCHLGPEQTDHSINVAHGLLKGDAEFEFPNPPIVPDPDAPDNCMFADCLLPAPEPPGPIAAVGGLILEEELEEAPQDAVEVEPRNFATHDNPATPWDERVVAAPGQFAFGDQGIYNIGLRPSAEDAGRGGDDVFGWPLSSAALALKNVGGEDFEPCDRAGDVCPMANFDPDIDYAGGLFEETGEGTVFPGTTHTLQSINPGFDREPISPMLPAYLAGWVNGMPAGELHPQIDEMAGMAPNTLTPPNGGPGIEFTEYLFGDDLHCGDYNPDLYGMDAPNYGWGPRCPNINSGVASNFEYPIHGTWPVPNRVLRQGAFKAPGLRNIELTAPYFHTGSYLTLRQVVDFYMRGGDFPLTNAEDRDPHMIDVDLQAFGFGGVTSPTLDPFADALPDGVYRYGPMPDVAHPLTPEPASSTPEAAKEALVRFLISLTDPRVKYERAPFDRPEIFVPVDGTAPDNTGGRVAMLADPRFQRVPEVGAEGHADALKPTLNLSSTPVAGPANDHFDR